jgi:hypothetical protein
METAETPPSVCDMSFADLIMTPKAFFLAASVDVFVFLS